MTSARALLADIETQYTYCMNNRTIKSRKNFKLNLLMCGELGMS